MYTLEFSARARAVMQRLHPSIAQQFRNKLEWLSENCDRTQHKALKGKHKGKFTLKVNDYRALYTFDRQTRVLTVHEAVHRSKIY